RTCLLFFSTPTRRPRRSTLFPYTTLFRSEPDAITVATEGIAAAVLPPPRAAGQFTGDPSPLLGKYKGPGHGGDMLVVVTKGPQRSEEHTSELQSRGHLVCRLLLEKKKKKK